ncbi:anoctamin-8 isoform X1 [Dunckerocampus dactyliophorus]|uniref:anoctamin-8 isoform X1 n=1 Tax=Dunckerocampus dactyliophorus TaxID=161453 RepID=UPI00240750F5|nr:anoctamin-8 isoform X1 [Dunckerocampus dactyliophorus]XP_054616028.1 anoctamin-8 isoform X1 [Dunckerocampus dactyliophorus]
MHATGTGAADAEAAVDTSGGADNQRGTGERMERTPPGELQHRTDDHHQQNQQQQQEPSSAAFGVLDKLFGKRLLQARHYILSRKSWLKMVPTENCDILMTFPDSIDDHTLLWLLNQIRVGIPQVSIQVRQHKHTQAYAFFITTTFENLLQGAEQMSMHKAVKPQFGGGMRRFTCEEDNIYENIESELCFFTSQERQSIIKYWLDNLRARHGEVLHNIHFLEGQPIIPELVTRGVIHQMFPLHEQRILNQLMTSWVQAVCERQPLDDICDYFGVKIGMYFAWLGFYTNSMLYPAVIGFLLWILAEADQTSQDICCVVFALFNVVWATLFLERWKRREAELAYRWGTLDTPAESLEEPRPQFRGVKRCSPITGCEEFYYPPWKRAVFRWLVSLPICLLCLCFVFLVMLLCLELQEVVMEIQELPGITRFIPKILLAITVTICDEVYKKIAYWLNDMENYRLQSAYDNNLIIKMVFFEFINSYLSLFYIGFYLKDMERLKEMLATLLIFRQFLQNIKEVLQPYLYEQNKLGVFTPKVLWELLQAIMLKYGRLALGKAQASMTAYSFLGPRGLPVSDGADTDSQPTTRGDLKAGFRLTEEEWDMTDSALKQRKVSFTEKVDYKDVVAETQTADDNFPEDSPTLVEDGMDACSIFDSCDEDSDLESLHQEARENTSVSSSRESNCLCQKRKTVDEVKEDKKSWIDPPEEPKTVTLTQAEIESCMQTYEDTLQDYQEMFIQFGYVVLFSSAFPLAAMCALINNIIEIRSDALKLCTGLQRPFGQRVENIGQWQTAMEAMGLIAIIVNCYLIGQCGQLQRLFPWLSPEMTIVSIVLLEHFAILLKYIIHVAIPDIPGWVAEEMAKLEYRRREAFKRHELQAQQHFQQQLRRRREEEELQRQAELQAEARQESDYHKSDAHHQHHHEKAAGGKPKRPSSLLGNNNVMKLKQIIPLQGKFSSSASRSPAQSPTGGEAKLAGFLKFLKSPEVKKEPASVAGSPGSIVTSSTPASGQERSQSPNRTFSPGKLFSFSKSEGTVVCANGPQPSSQADCCHPTSSHEELPSRESDKGDSDLESSGSKC